MYFFQTNTCNQIIIRAPQNIFPLGKILCDAPISHKVFFPWEKYFVALRHAPRQGPTGSDRLRRLRHAPTGSDRLPQPPRQGPTGPPDRLPTGCRQAADRLPTGSDGHSDELPTSCRQAPTGIPIRSDMLLRHHLDIICTSSGHHLDIIWASCAHH